MVKKRHNNGVEVRVVVNHCIAFGLELVIDEGGTDD